VAVCSWGLALPASASAGATDPLIATTDGELQNAVAEFVGDADGGAVVYVVRDGVTATAAAGAANATGDPMTPDTAFRVGSLTKPFTATIVLQLVDEGHVDLDETLSAYLPATRFGGDVTIRELLQHRSGLPDYLGNREFVASLLADRTQVFSPDDLLGMVEDLPFEEPGRVWAYSNTNYILLGQLIEQIEGTDLATVVQQRIVGPLGLDATQLAVVGGPPIDGLAGPWSPDLFEGDPDDDYDSIVSVAWAAGGIVSAADDLHTFLDALFGGDLLSDEALSAMTDADRDGYGLGIGTLDLPSGLRLYGHGGDIFGYLGFMAFDRDTRDTMIVLTNNSELPPDQLAEPLLADW
jgi:D-alanyl-D-alanine carboxypeptidase